MCLVTHLSITPWATLSNISSCLLAWFKHFIKSKGRISAVLVQLLFYYTVYSSIKNIIYIYIIYREREREREREERERERERERDRELGVGVGRWTLRHPNHVVECSILVKVEPM